MRRVCGECEGFVRKAVREGMAVHLRPELLMTPERAVVTREEVRRAERALAWVLWALFAYAEQVGVKRAVFW